MKSGFFQKTFNAPDWNYKCDYCGTREFKDQVSECSQCGKRYCSEHGDHEFRISHNSSKEGYFCYSCLNNYSGDQKPKRVILPPEMQKHFQKPIKPIFRELESSWHGVTQYEWKAHTINNCEKCPNEMPGTDSHRCDICGLTMCPDCWGEGKEISFYDPYKDEHICNTFSHGRYCYDCFQIENQKDIERKKKEDTLSSLSCQMSEVREKMDSEYDSFELSKLEMEMERLISKYHELAYKDNDTSQSFMDDWEGFQFDDDYDDDSPNNDEEQDSPIDNCPNCGSTDQEIVTCHKCGKEICKSCSNTKGFIRKKHFCNECCEWDDEQDEEEHCDDTEGFEESSFGFSSGGSFPGKKGASTGYGSPSHMGNTQVAGTHVHTNLSTGKTTYSGKLGPNTTYSFSFGTGQGRGSSKGSGGDPSSGASGGSAGSPSAFSSGSVFGNSSGSSSSGGSSGNSGSGGQSSGNSGSGGQGSA